MLRLRQLIRFPFCSFNCWKCTKHNQIAQLECNSCGHLLQPDYSIKKQNYFTLFCIPVTFNIDKNYINSKTQYFQKKYHPDKYNSREQQLQKYASEFSSYVNEARDVLLNDVKRMQYLLKIKGINHEKLETEAESHSSPSFLTAIFQLQQQIAQSQSVGKLDRLLKQCAQQQRRLGQLFWKEYQKNNMDQVIQAYGEYKYYESAISSILNKKAQLISDGERAEVMREK